MRHRVVSTRSGLTLVEVVIAMTVFTVLTMMLAAGMQTAIMGGEQAWRQNLAMSAARDRIAAIQSFANADTSVFPSQGLANVHAAFNDTTVPIPGLPQGTVKVVFFINETEIPAVFGGPRDINLDGDAGDGSTTVAGNPPLPGSDAKLLPTVITVQWSDGPGGLNTLTLHHILTRTRI
jgi:prepilin-type N-terminal cleavage/methylation domain-containing protein